VSDLLDLRQPPTKIGRREPFGHLGPQPDRQLGGG
jgi:hypothetical protein